MFLGRRVWKSTDTPLAFVLLGPEAPSTRQRQEERVVNVKRRLTVSSLCALACAVGVAVPAGAVASTKAKKASSLYTIQWGQVVYSPAYWAIYAGQQRGFFKKQGIAVNITLIPSSPNIIAAAAGGSIDMFATTSDAAVAAITQGAKIKLISGIQRVNGVQLVTAPGTKTIVSLANQPIGVTNLTAADAVLFKAVLAQHGVTAFDPVVSGSFPTKTTALLANQIKAAELTPPYTQQVVAAGGRLIGNGSVAVGGDDYAGWLSVGASAPWLSSHRKQAVSFLKGYQAALNWLYNAKNKAAAIKVLTNPNTGLTVGQAKTVYSSFISSYHPKQKSSKATLTSDLTAPDLREGIKLAKQEGATTASNNVNTYWDQSYMKAALK
jgi:ABC-type nitrate/sulfonate/bicarbonate transport system substrate-binding protein